MTKHIPEPPPKGPHREKPAKKVGDPTPNPLPEDESEGDGGGGKGGDPGRS